MHRLVRAGRLTTRLPDRAGWALILLAAPIPLAMAHVGVTPWGRGRDLLVLGFWWHAVWIAWFYCAPVLLVGARWASVRRPVPWTAAAWTGAVLVHLMVVVAVAARFAAWATPLLWAGVAITVAAGLGALWAGVGGWQAARLDRARRPGFR